jgi:hypothetical protein
MMLPRMFFDTNDGSMEDGYRLGFDQSRKDLDALGTALRDEAAVTIYMPKELQMTATLRLDPNGDAWWADPVADTITHLDGSA